MTESAAGGAPDAATLGAATAEPSPVSRRRRHRLSGPSAGRRWPVAVLGLVLVATGSGAHVAGSQLPEASAEALTGNMPVNEGALDDLDISSHNSPTLVQNPVRPGNLAVVNRVDTPRFGCGLHLSFDAGATWADGRLPFPEGEEDPPRCFAPDAAFGPDGTLHVSFVTLAGLGNTPNALWSTSSRDGGRTFATPVRVAGPRTFQPRLSVDLRGRLLLSWLQGGEVGLLKFANAGNPIMVAASDDGGSSWRSPLRVTPPARARAVAASTAIGPDGELLLLYLDLLDDVLDYHGAHEGRGGEPYPGAWQLVLARSRDGGRTWREAVVEEHVVPPQRVVVFFPPFPSLVVDARRRLVHVAFADARLGDSDVWLWTSRDGGRTFGRRVRVNDTRTGDGSTQNLPRLAVSPDGRLDVVYYDRRLDRRDVMNEVSFQSSYDGGSSFTPRVVLSDTPFDSRIGFLRERGLPDLGSRLALLSLEARAMAVWTDTRAGTEASGKQDLARGVVALFPPSPLRTPLRAGGAALVAAGLAALGFALVSRTRRRSAAGASPGRPPDGAGGAHEEVPVGARADAGGE